MVPGMQAGSSADPLCRTGWLDGDGQLPPRGLGEPREGHDAASKMSSIPTDCCPNSPLELRPVAKSGPY